AEFAVGKIHVGPRPSSQLPASFGLGEISWSRVTSPNVVERPIALGSPGSGSGWGVETKSGMTGRVMRFQSESIATGSTGWNSRLELQRSSSPLPGSTRKLFCWNVRDQRSLTGLVSFLLISVSDSPCAQAGAATVAASRRTIAGRNRSVARADTRDPR